MERLVLPNSTRFLVPIWHLQGNKSENCRGLKMELEWKWNVEMCLCFGALSTTVEYLCRNVTSSRNIACARSCMYMSTKVTVHAISHYFAFHAIDPPVHLLKNVWGLGALGSGNQIVDKPLERA